MSRIESGRLTLRREEFSFSSMLEQINTMVTSQCTEKGLDYECHVIGHVDDRLSMRTWTSGPHVTYH